MSEHFLKGTWWFFAVQHKSLWTQGVLDTASLEWVAEELWGQGVAGSTSNSHQGAL